MGILEGKHALVTGATSGIGEAIAKSFADEGASVGINHLPEEDAAAREVVDTIREAGGEAIPVSGDVSDVASVDAMGDVLENEFESMDILVNNAGILTTSPIESMSTQTWDEVIDVNLRGMFLTTRRILPLLRRSDDGTIINIASQLGFKGKENMVHYCASKGGVISFTRSLARELAPDITVNGIAPGPIDTNISEVSESERREIEKSLPLQRIGEVDDVAPTAVFLASNDANYYTGQILSPDSGDAMH